MKAVRRSRRKRSPLLPLLLLIFGCSTNGLEPSGLAERNPPTPSRTGVSHAPDTKDGETLSPARPVSTTTAPTATVTTQVSTTTTATTPSTATTATTTSTLPPPEPPTYEVLDGINTILDFTDFTSSDLGRWEESVAGIQDIRLTSTADGSEQPALWLAPRGDRDRPLLVILHSWSAPYLQHAGIPYAMWAEDNGWAMIAPDFRGVNDDTEAMGSDLAVQDVVDAIDYATSRDGVDADRVYAVGYSGGGMMSLLLAGRHPEKVTAAVAWGPPIDLVDFYRQSVSAGRPYAGQIRAVCGGNPTSDESAREECLVRSPRTYLDEAREEGVAVYIGQGIRDSLLSPRHGARAFNQLADPGDRFSDDEIDEIGRNSLPARLSGSTTTETYFDEGDPAPVFSRQSDDVRVVFFDAGHDMVYKATLRWFASDLR